MNRAASTTPISEGATLGAKKSRGELGWLDKRLGTGRETTRNLYAWSRRLRNRTELARRRDLVPALVGGSVPAIPAHRGYASIRAGQIPEANEIAEIARKLADDRGAGATSGKKQQLRSGLLDTSELTLESPFLRFILRPDIIGCVSNYLGFVPLLARVDVWASVPSSGLANSQLFHCDWADLSQVKVFVHGSDVDAENGPLVALGAETSQRIRRRLNYRWRGKRYRVTDDEVATLGGDADRHEFVGPAGSVALVDTCRCFHFGSRLAQTSAPRVIAVFQFLLPSAFSISPAPRDRGLFRGLATPDMPELERLVLGPN